MGAIEDHNIYGLTVRESATDGSDFTNAPADYRRLFLGEDGLLHLKDSAGTVTNIGSGDITTDPAWAAKGDLIVGTGNDTAAVLTAGTNDYLLSAASGEATGLKWVAAPAGGAVATDAIWDAAGDLAVGSGANTAAKLTKGADGGVLAMGNGVVIWNAGTSFPASKATGDRYWRTDLGLEFYWDGTRWLSTCQYRADIAVNRAVTPATANASLLDAAVVGGAYAIYVETVVVWCYVVTTNDGSKYWTILVQAGPSTTTLASVNTSADAANTHIGKVASPNAVIAATDFTIGLSLTKTSTPGNLFVGAAVLYRRIAT